MCEFSVIVFDVRMFSFVASSMAFIFNFSFVFAFVVNILYLFVFKKLFIVKMGGLMFNMCSFGMLFVCMFMNLNDRNFVNDVRYFFGAFLSSMLFLSNCLGRIFDSVVCLCVGMN